MRSFGPPPAEAGVASGLSVWLIPGGAPGARLRETIAGLAARLGTQPFDPHVTLLAGLSRPETEAREACRRFASATVPLRASVTGGSHGDEFFRCIFLEIQRSPELIEAHSRLRRLFGAEERVGPFLPHVSLVYGSLDAAARRLLVAELDAGSSILPLARVELVRTQGPVERWVVAESLPLAASGS